jgi:hypothetical protein
MKVVGAHLSCKIRRSAARAASPPGQGEAGKSSVIPMSMAIEESVDFAHEIYNRVFRTVPERLMDK